MEKNEISTQLSLLEIIKKKTRREAIFDDLDDREKLSVLEYINNNSLDNKVFDIKGYDVLTNTFFAYEYILDKTYFNGFTKKKVLFENLDDFICYVKYDIYDKTCFYGYELLEEDIQKYSIDKTKINFDSFIDYSIKDFSFEKYQQETKIDSEERENKILKIKKYIDKIECIDSLNTFLKLYKNFNRKFISFI